MAEGLTISSTSALSNMSAIVIANAIANVEPAGPTASLVTRYNVGHGIPQTAASSGDLSRRIRGPRRLGRSQIPGQTGIPPRPNQASDGRAKSIERGP